MYAIPRRSITLSLIALLGCADANRAGEPRVFFGNLHSHTCYSDGSGTPEDAYRHARYEARLACVVRHGA